MHTILMPFKSQTFYVGGHVHKVPDEIASLKVRDDLVLEAGPRWIACVLLANGNGALAPSSRDLMMPWLDEQVDFIRRLAIRLNKEHAAGGHWLTALDDEQDWYALWRDGDGDLQFSISDSEPWERGKRQPIEDAIGVCIEAWHEWHREIFGVLDVRPHETFKRAQGQRPLWRA